MGVRITRLQRNALRRVTESNTSSIWSARDLFPVGVLRKPEPTVAEHVVPRADGHLSDNEVKQLFDGLWTKLRGARGVVVELDMTNVRTAAARFMSELEFFTRQIRRLGGEVRLATSSDSSFGVPS